MSMSSPTAEWDRLGDGFYRKVQLYTGVFDDDLELDNYVVAGAPYSGALGESVEKSLMSGADVRSLASR